MKKKRFVFKVLHFRTEGMKFENDGLNPIFNWACDLEKIMNEVGSVGYEIKESFSGLEGELIVFQKEIN